MRSAAQRGFTLPELLIVVTIIVILVAVSVPVFSNKLEESREAADLANMQAAKEIIVTAFMTDTPSGTVEVKADTAYGYSAEDGFLVEQFSASAAPYGKGRADSGNYGCAALDCFFYVCVDQSGQVTGCWDKGLTSPGAASCQTFAEAYPLRTTS